MPKQPKPSSKGGRDPRAQHTPAAIGRLREGANHPGRPGRNVSIAEEGRGHFPNDEAATKLLWLALRNIRFKHRQYDTSSPDVILLHDASQRY